MYRERRRSAAGLLSKDALELDERRLSSVRNGRRKSRWEASGAPLGKTLMVNLAGRVEVFL